MSTRIFFLVNSTYDYKKGTLIESSIEVNLTLANDNNESQVIACLSYNLSNPEMFSENHSLVNMLYFRGKNRIDLNVMFSKSATVVEFL